MSLPPTTNLALVLPEDHLDPNVWGDLLNTALGEGGPLDGHDHTTGKGVRIPSAALNINADVSWATHAISSLLAVDFAPVSTALVSGFAGALFINSADSELYYRTTGGVNVQLTDGAALNVAAFAGGIGGDYTAVGALFSYDDATDSYWAQQEEILGVRAWARMRVADVDIYEKAASIANRVRIMSPAALAASYALTLPAALGVATVPLGVSSAGVTSLDGIFTGNLTAPDLRYTTTQGIPLLGAQFEDVSGITHVKFNSASGAHVGWTLAISTNPLSCPLPVREGDVIGSMVVWLNKNSSSAATLTARIYRQALNGAFAESAVSAAGTNALNTPGATTISVVGIGATVAAGFTYYITFTPSAGGAGGDVLYGATLGITRP